MADKDIAIKVQDLTKSFKIPLESSSGIKQKMINVLKGKKGYREFTPLKDVSFEIEKGDFFGIVGRNGSGKSTLLKSIAGIYAPTKGAVHVDGTLVPFIELGVGFNPELTGRENVFLNGALLGFSHAEMEAMYDEIVDFAEIGDFMEEKLKNYSSGMQVRLAFSIAIKAEGDILLLDEVLAVGDEAFQRKCNEYFANIKNSGKTIVLVTHSMDSVRKYCNKAMLVHDGKIKAVGSPDDIANEYTMENFRKQDTAGDGKHQEGLSDKVTMLRIVPVSKQVLTNKDDLIVDIEYRITDDTPIVVHIGIDDEIRDVVILNNGAKVAGKGEHKLRYTMPVSAYNDCNLRVYAVIDEVDTKNRIAFTSDRNSYRCLIRNKIGNYGLINTSSPVHGSWDGIEDFVYNRNKEIHGD